MFKILNCYFRFSHLTILVSAAMLITSLYIRVSGEKTVSLSPFHVRHIINASARSSYCVDFEDWSVIKSVIVAA